MKNWKKLLILFVSSIFVSFLTSFFLYNTTAYSFVITLYLFCFYILWWELGIRDGMEDIFRCTFSDKLRVTVIITEEQVEEIIKKIKLRRNKMEEVKPQKILKKRLRDSKNNPYGMVVALNRNQLGYSICNTKAGDKYDDEKAFKRAINRAVSQKETNFNFWEKVIERQLAKHKRTWDDAIIGKYNILNVIAELEFMQERAIRYFK